MKPNPRKKSKPWVYGEVVDKPAPRSCAVSTPLGLVRPNHAQIRKASYSEPVSIDTDVASDTFEQVGDPSSSNIGGVEQIADRWNSPSMRSLNVMQHRKSCCGGRPGTGSCPSVHRLCNEH